MLRWINIAILLASEQNPVLLPSSHLLNQACARRRSARTWFLKIDHMRIVCMRVCVCVSAPEAINN